jgi:hypothetical protein
LVSSLAFADNPSDAPLATHDGNTAMTQPQNCDGKSRQQSNKDESASSKRKQKNGRRPATQNRPDSLQGNSDYPVVANEGRRKE